MGGSWAKWLVHNQSFWFLAHWATGNWTDHNWLQLATAVQLQSVAVQSSCQSLYQLPTGLQNTNRTGPISTPVPPSTTTHMENPQHIPHHSSISIQRNHHAWTKLLISPSGHDRIRKGVWSWQDCFLQRITRMMKVPDHMERLSIIGKHLGTQIKPPTCVRDSQHL